MILVWSETQFDQRARVRNDLCLPPVGSLKTNHGILGSLVPDSVRLSCQVMLANQRFLYLPRSIRIHLLLTEPPARFFRTLPLARARMHSSGPGGFPGSLRTACVMLGFAGRLRPTIAKAQNNPKQQCNARFCKGSHRDRRKLPLQPFS